MNKLDNYFDDDRLQDFTALIALVFELLCNVIDPFRIQWQRREKSDNLKQRERERERETLCNNFDMYIDFLIGD